MSACAQNGIPSDSTSTTRRLAVPEKAGYYVSADDELNARDLRRQSHVAQQSQAAPSPWGVCVSRQHQQSRDLRLHGRASAGDARA
jgi:hypothetical protein